MGQPCVYVLNEVTWDTKGVLRGEPDGMWVNVWHPGCGTLTLLKRGVVWSGAGSLGHVLVHTGD